MVTGFSMRALLAAPACALIGWLSPLQASAAPLTADTSRCDVETLEGLTSSEIVVVEQSGTGASPVTTPQLVVESATVQSTPRPHCWVAAHIHTEKPHAPAENPDVPYHEKEIQFTLALPTAWNEKFLMTGCGAFCGRDTIDPRQVDLPGVLDRGYATARTDTGHTGGTSYGGWTRNLDGTQNVDRIINYGYRGIHLATIAAKPLVARYYERAPSLSYFSGGSNGGRQGLIEAQKYPRDFDGIIADRPAVNLPGFISAFIAQANAEFPVDRFHPVLPPALMPLLGRTTMTRCDPVDGLRDGIISNPTGCKLNPWRDLPACPGDVARSTCFTRAQINVIDTVYRPKVTNSMGTIYPGFLPGYEDAVLGGNGWSNFGWIVGDPALSPDDYPTLGYASGEQFLKFLVFNDPDYVIQNFNVRTQGHYLFTSPTGMRLSQIMYAENPDLSAFKMRGGKLILTHGWADILIHPLATIRYYTAVASQMRGLRQTRDFMRLFLVPGGLHGGPANEAQPFVDPVAGLGPALDALEAWRERGVAPNSLPAFNTGGTPGGITRPVCAYPQVATYRGRGSIYEASSFACK